MFIPFYSLYWVYTSAEFLDDALKRRGVYSDDVTISVVCEALTGMSSLYLQYKINILCDLIEKAGETLPFPPVPAPKITEFNVTFQKNITQNPKGNLLYWIFVAIAIMLAIAGGILIYALAPQIIIGLIFIASGMFSALTLTIVYIINVVKMEQYLNYNDDQKILYSAEQFEPLIVEQPKQYIVEQPKQYTVEQPKQYTVEQPKQYTVEQNAPTVPPVVTQNVPQSAPQATQNVVQKIVRAKPAPKKQPKKPKPIRSKFNKSFERKVIDSKKGKGVYLFFVILSITILVAGILLSVAPKMTAKKPKAMPRLTSYLLFAHEHPDMTVRASNPEIHIVDADIHSYSDGMIEGHLSVSLTYSANEFYHINYEFKNDGSPTRISYELKNGNKYLMYLTNGGYSYQKKSDGNYYGMTETLFIEALGKVQLTESALENNAIKWGESFNQAILECQAAYNPLFISDQIDYKFVVSGAVLAVAGFVSTLVLVIIYTSNKNKIEKHRQYLAEKTEPAREISEQNNTEPPIEN